MSFLALVENIKQEKRIAREVYTLMNYVENIQNLERNKKIQISPREKKLINGAVLALISQLKILNNSIPEIIRNIGFYKELPTLPKEKKKFLSDLRGKNLIKMKYSPPEEDSVSVTINKKDRDDFMRNLSLSNLAMEKIKRDYKIDTKRVRFKKASRYAKISNRVFKKLSNHLVDKGYFKKLNLGLRKISSPFLLNSYISMMLFSVLISVAVAIVVYVTSWFYGFSIEIPFLIPTAESVVMRALKNIWIILIIPVFTFFSFYYYPLSEERALRGKIEQELPFVTIYMSAIATSGVSPVSIFKIISSSKDYPTTRREINKLLNQITFYGYDLGTALKNSASRSPSKKLAELFNGLATAISSGGDLKKFLEKHSESLLFDYRLEREAYTRSAETFMNLYISVVIAAPMILMILFVMINMTGMSFYGLSNEVMTFLIIFGIAILNVVFLVFLQIRQPTY